MASRFSKSLLLTSALVLLAGCDDTALSNPAVNIVQWWKAVFSNARSYEDGFQTPSLDEMEFYPIKTSSGSYLSARFAQGSFDWASADTYMREVMSVNPDDLDLQRRSMVLSMGAGDSTTALKLAREIVKNKKDETSLPRIFLALEKYKTGDYAGTLKDLETIPDDGISDFVKPMIRGWAMAGEGKSGIDQMNKNVVHIYHTILISDYLNDKEALRGISQKDLSALSLSSKSLERIADIYARQGLSDAAKKLYQEIQAESPRNDSAEEKLKQLEKPAPQTPDLASDRIQNPKDGLAQALFDMATVLHQEYTDSARLFAYMSLFLDPEMKDAHILLAYMSTDFKRYEDAIAHYQEINPKDDAALKLKIERQIADLLEESGKAEQAISILEDLVRKEKSVESQIQIGDIYRRQENYTKALASYNQAATMLDHKIPQEYWNLLYARGIAHERLKNWKQAEEDLKAALAYEPDHPYILNYLAYSWTDQGKNLDKALEMINKAARLQPGDGYIIDSLGWVYYKLERYQDAVNVLERAIELMPYDATVNDHLGDAYWHVGREAEAKFQWKRALSFIKDEHDLVEPIENKITNGLGDSRHAHDKSRTIEPKDSATE